MICPNCHAEVSDSMKFCENCGSALSANTEQTQNAYSSQDFQQQSPVQPPTRPSSQMRTTDPYADAAHFDQQPPSAYGDAQQFGQPPTDEYTETQQFGQQATDYNDTQQFGQQTTGQPYATPTPPDVYAPAGTSPQPSIAPFVLAIIALITSLLGLFPVSIVLAIIALVMNSGQKKRGQLSTKQTPTTIMSVISLVISALMLVLTIMMGGLIAAYVASEGLGSSSGSTSSFLTAPKSSSGSAGAAGTTGGNSSATNASGLNSEIAEKLAGTWKLTGLTSNGQVTTLEDIELMQDMGLNIELVLNADGTATFTLFGATMNGTWESSDGSAVILTIEGGRIDATVTGDVLSLVEGTDEMSFTKQ